MEAGPAPDPFQVPVPVRLQHHIGDFNTSATWAAICNELRARVAQLFLDQIIGGVMLPQSPGTDPATCIAELKKCVKEYGMVGINLNPDPSGGHWTSPPLSDKAWYMVYERWWNTASRR